VENISVRFVCVGGDKKLIVFYENETKNLKHELVIKSGVEYVLYIPIANKDFVSFFVTPNIPTSNGDTRTLGLYIKQIYVGSNQNEVLKLVDTLNEEFESYTKSNTIATDNQPKFVEVSCTKQRENVSILNFNYTKKQQYYNPAIFTYNDTDYLMVRNSSWVKKNIMSSTIRLYDYNTLKEIEMNIDDELDFEQYDDPRVLVHNDKIYVGCATYTHEKYHIVHQKIMVFDNKFKHIHNIHPKYGCNGKSLDQNTGKEKNWTYFIHENKLMCVYQLYPHTVVEFDWEGNVVCEHITHNKNIQWNYGLLRGGTNPVFKDGYYHSFFHSSIPWKHEHRRRYFMGHYKFEPVPPFRIVEISKEPILWGNEDDELIYPDISPLVIFPCGTIIRDDKFVVSFGLNDEKTGIIKV
jgi:predicted GH43/DUF377 family glycosyl hydrolase